MITTVAMALLGAAALGRRVAPPWAGLVWLGALAAGLLGGAVPWAFAAAGVLFGAGFVAAGVDLARRPFDFSTSRLLDFSTSRLLDRSTRRRVMNAARA